MVACLDHLHPHSITVIIVAAVVHIRIVAAPLAGPVLHHHDQGLGRFRPLGDCCQGWQGVIPQCIVVLIMDLIWGFLDMLLVVVGFMGVFMLLRHQQLLRQLLLLVVLGLVVLLLLVVPVMVLLLLLLLEMLVLLLGLLVLLLLLLPQFLNSLILVIKRSSQHMIKRACWHCFGCCLLASRLSTCNSCWLLCRCKVGPCSFHMCNCWVLKATRYEACAGCDASLQPAGSTRSVARGSCTTVT